MYVCTNIEYRYSSTLYLSTFFFFTYKTHQKFSKPAEFTKTLYIVPVSANAEKKIVL